MAEPLILLGGLAAAMAFVLLPLRRPRPAVPAGDELEAAAIRHRAALEALRDVEADRRSGSLDDDGYERQLAEAEARAAGTRAALDAVPGDPPEPAPAGPGRRAAMVAAALIGVALVGGSLLEGSGIANATIVNQSLANAEAAESARQARITQLLGALSANPSDPETLSDLADAYLGGSNRDDLVRAAVALRVLVEIEPERADAYERIIVAYLRADDFANARAAHDAYMSLPTADPAEAAFFDGLIALRGEGDPERAVAAFETFLELAPEDPRARMVRGLRDEAESGG